MPRRPVRPAFPVRGRSLADGPAAAAHPVRTPTRGRRFPCPSPLRRSHGAAHRRTRSWHRCRSRDRRRRVARRRQAARHRFEDRQTESFAAVRVDQHVTRRIQTREIRIVEVVRQVEDRRKVGRVRQPFKIPAHGLVAVRRLRAVFLDHEADVILRAERVEVRLQQHVDAFAEDRASDEEKSDPAIGFERQRLEARAEQRGIDAVRDDIHTVPRNAGADVDLLHVVARHPRFVDVRAERREPRAGQRAPFPGLDVDPLRYEAAA